MQIMKKITDYIEDELRGSEEYIVQALEIKDGNKAIADILYEMSEDEMKHVNNLHALGVKFVDEYKQTGKNIPESMQSVYDYLHKKHIEHANKIKVYQAQYKGQ